MKVLVVIPARYGSTRFEGKVLAKATGKYLFQHTYERALSANLVEQVIIAADDDRVFYACNEFGAPCVMTSADCPSGTDRIAQAAADLDAEIIINLQADEPEIDPDSIDVLAQLLIDNPSTRMATLVADFQSCTDVADPNIVKVILDNAGRAVYFSRSPIPYDRNAAGIGPARQYLRHIGIYAFRRDFLMTFTSLPQGRLEQIEKLEQLRAIENGFAIITAKITHAWEGIDTPRQYEDFVKRYKGQR